MAESWSLAKLPFLFRLLVTLLLFVQAGNCIKINSDGGYEVVVALQEATPEPSIGASSYINNIQVSLREFGFGLWTATKTHFYLKSVDIIVPSNWNVTDAQRVTEQNFQNADIRLSAGVPYARADNPNVCGEPGNYIELPSDFFNQTRNGAYGLHSKSLLHMWAMYRFGVHPEHGFIGDSKYPYATRESKQDEWTITGCSNEPILGKLTNIINPDNGSCEHGDTFNESCRFVPATRGQTATSSLMHFHWVESVNEFCNEDTHNYFAQNKQNVLCDHKSVWQVIRESPDYLAVESPLGSAPPTAFNVLQYSKDPFLYILLDRGMIQGSRAIANKIPRIIRDEIFEDSSLGKTIGAIGAYPGNAGSPISDLVEWSELATNNDAFLDALGNLKIDGPLHRDFSRALVAVADKIKRTNHPNGAVVLVVKFGADVNNFDTYIPEAEVIHAFNEANIFVNSIELNFPNHTGYSHLAKLAQETGGSYVTLQNYGEVETNIRNVLGHVKKALKSEFNEQNSWKLLHKDVITISSIIPVSNDINKKLEIFVSSPNGDLLAANFSVSSSGSTQQDVSFNFRKSLDWNEQGSKYTYKLDISRDQLGNASALNLRLLCGAPRCATNVLARAQAVDTSIKVQLTTSVENGIADLSSGRPVSIFAKVTKNGIPVQDAVVVAYITDTLSASISQAPVRLIDDGYLSPDVQELDCVYSAYFAPFYDSTFKLSVSVQGNAATRRRGSVSLPTKLNESSYSRLLPIDQGDTGCGAGSCDSEIIEENFMQIYELSSSFEITNSASFYPKPAKIVSLMAVDQPSISQVDLYWQSPKVPARDFTVTSYDLRSAPSLQLLISDFDNQTKVAVPPSFRPLPPTSMEKISVSRPNTTTYYAVRSEYRGRKSVTSNFAVVVVENSEATTQPPASTSTDSSSPGVTDQTSTENSNPTAPTEDPSSTSTGGTSGEPTSPGGTDPGDNSTPSTDDTAPPEDTTPDSGASSLKAVVSIWMLTIFFLFH